MERTMTEGAPPGWDAYEAIPRDGPAIFAAAADALERGEIRGTWLPLNQPIAELHARLSDVGIDPQQPGAWTVIDQVELGAVMVDEQPDLPALGHDAPDGSPS